MRFSFFAYGSFSKGQVHFSKFVNFIQGEKSAMMKADLYRLRCGYPLAVPSGTGQWVQGSLFELEVTENFWPVMDGILGFDLQQPDKSLVQRSEVPVKLNNFTQTNAYTYGLNPKKIVSAHKKITDCDWQKDLRLHPPVTESLEGRQRDYLKKLAQSRGREIVPIKLDLYRELMNLEIIVDKGRRLALTPMGKEAVLFTQ